MKLPIPLFLFTLLFTAPTFVNAKDEVNLVPEGSFEAGSVVVAPARQPGAWTLSPGNFAALGAKQNMESEEGIDFLRLISSDRAGTLNVETTSALPSPVPAEVTVSFRVRATEVAPPTEAGPEWLSAQVQVSFYDSGDKQLKLEIPFRVKTDTAGWEEVEKTIIVPEGATSIKVQAGFWGYFGTFDFADFKVVPN